jgi:hypothetical protein
MKVRVLNYDNRNLNNPILENAKDVDDVIGVKTINVGHIEYINMFPEDQRLKYEFPSNHDVIILSLDDDSVITYPADKVKVIEYQKATIMDMLEMCCPGGIRQANQLKDELIERCGPDAEQWLQKVVGKEYDIKDFDEPDYSDIDDER